MRLSLFSLKQCIIKQFYLLDSVFVISGIIKVSVSVILTSTLIIPDITKTSSNNCLLFVLIRLALNLTKASIVFMYHVQSTCPTVCHPPPPPLLKKSPVCMHSGGNYIHL